MARWRKYSCRKSITFIKPAVYCQDETVVLKNVPHYLSGKHGAWNTFFYWVYMGGAWGGHLLQAVARIFTPTASQSWPVSSWCSPALRGGCECSPCRWRKREKQHGDSRSCTPPKRWFSHQLICRHLKCEEPGWSRRLPCSERGAGLRELMGFLPTSSCECHVQVCFPSCSWVCNMNRFLQ